MSETPVVTPSPAPIALTPIPLINEPAPLKLDGIYPPHFAAFEQELIARRRKEWAGADPQAPVAGLALSGGGIRSATFCLGVLQGLARRKLLQRFDFLSTVSGGGYIGSFVGAWMSRCGAKSVQDNLPNCDHPSLRYLRNNGRYLAPNGAADLMSAMAAHLRSWVTIWIVLGTLLVGGFLVAEAFKAGLRHDTWVMSVQRMQAAGVTSSTPASVAPLPDDVRRAVVEVANAITAAATPQPSLLAQMQARLDPSPFFYVTLWALLFLVVPPGIAYWFVGDWRKLKVLWAVLLAATGAFGYWLFGGDGAAWTIARQMAATSCLLYTLVLCVGAAAYADARERGRNRCTDLLSGAFTITVGLAGFAVVDTIGQSLALGFRWWIGGALLPALAAVAQWVLPRLADASKRRLPPWLGSLLLPIVATIVTALILGILSMSAHELAAVIGDSVPGGVAATATAAIAVLAAAVAALLLAAMLGLKFVFINASSHHRLYSARLTRAYLGASNPLRTGPQVAQGAVQPGAAAKFDPKIAPQDVTATLSGDQIEFTEYRPHERGGPLHLINTTVNETISGISNIESRDRHGFSLAVGPAGLSVRLRDHATLHNPGIANPPVAPAGRVIAWGGKAERFHTLAVKNSDHVAVEMPAVGEWIGISGAAFTTGLGARTSTAFSLLLGCFNIRLGYWWDSGVKPRERVDIAPRTGLIRFGDILSAGFRAQTGLLDEFLARFRGPARRHWYLSDGGHFENTAAYELIRRRVPFIVCCDCGADPASTFDDVANLVRKARTDFGAEITFWTPDDFLRELGPNYVQNFPQLASAVGSLVDLAADTQPPTAGLSPRHAALAWVTYGNAAGAEEGRSLLLLIKPTLSADLPTDILNYHAANPAFPQEPTLDQFFDEAQWESYRKLGETIAGKVFGDPGSGGSIEWDTLARIAKKYSKVGAQLRAVA